jgi:hypothetical protein
LRSPDSVHWSHTYSRAMDFFFAIGHPPRFSRRGAGGVELELQKTRPDR